MSFRVEKESNGEHAIVISGWEKGVASSAENGLQLVQNASLEIEGELAFGWPIANQTIASGSLGQLTYGCVDYSVSSGLEGNWGWNGTYTYYMLDAAGAAWGSSGDGTWHPLGNTTTSAGATNQGIVVWHGYIFVFRDSHVDYAATNNPTSWTSGWKSITSGTYHTAIVNPINDYLIFCNGNNVGYLFWNGGSAFDPTSASTYTFNAAALQLPLDEQSVSLSYLGTNVMIGGITNRIYPWNSGNGTSYGAPILMPETFVWRMVNANNFLYIFMGQHLSRGRIYVTSGSAVSEFFKMPDSLANSIEPYWQWGDAIWHRNHLVFGVQAFANSGDTAISNASQVYALKLGISLLGSTEQRFFAINSLLSKQLASVLLPVVGNTAKGGWDYFVGLWDTAGTTANYAIATSISGSGNDGSVTAFSDIIPVGTLLKPKTFAQIEFKLSAPLGTNETVSLYYRSNISASFTQIGSTFTATNTAPSGGIAGTATFNVQNLQWIQLQVNNLGFAEQSHVRLTEVRIR